MRSDIQRFSEWLKSSGEDRGMDIVGLWDRYEADKSVATEPGKAVNVDELPQYRKPRFKDEK